jgi:hypothetical protein
MYERLGSVNGIGQVRDEKLRSEERDSREAAIYSVGRRDTEYGQQKEEEEPFLDSITSSTALRHHPSSIEPSSYGFYLL